MPGAARLAVEIAVQDAGGAGRAIAAGADRVELCGALGVGGLTPSAGAVEAAVAAAEDAGRPGAVHVLVRPRPGGFVYSAEEVRTASRDIELLRHRGVAGFVVGALDADGRIDRRALERWIDAADGAPLAFHRAIDASASPLDCLDALLGLPGLPVGRVLTSGAATRSIDGAPVLRELVQRSDGRIEVMAGGGVAVAHIGALAGLGIDAVHLSARRPARGGGPSGPGGGDDAFDETDATVVAAAVSAARGFESRRGAASR